MPEWSLTPLRLAEQQLRLITDVLEVSVDGVGSLRNLPEIVDFLARSDEVEPDAEHLERAKRLASIAKREVEDGFPLLAAQGVVSLTTALEVFVERLVAAWLEHGPGAMDVEAVQKLKIRLGEYESLEAPDRFEYVAELLEREVGTPLREGVTRFEDLLAAFGLDGEVPAEVGKSLFELFHVRNAIVHREARADRRLTNACPWLDLQPGEPLRTNMAMFAGYARAIDHYMVVVMKRVEARIGT